MAAAGNYSLSNGVLNLNLDSSFYDWITYYYSPSDAPEYSNNVFGLYINGGFVDANTATSINLKVGNGKATKFPIIKGTTATQSSWLTALGNVGTELNGSSKNDYLIGGNSSDTLNGGNGNDFLFGGFQSIADSLRGGLGDDTYQILNGAGADVIDDAGGKSDTLLFRTTNSYGEFYAYRKDSDLLVRSYKSATEYDLITVKNFTTTGRIEKFIYSNADTAIYGVFTLAVGNNGTSAADWILGTESADILKGLAGNDVLSGWDGNDILNGGAGYDTLVGGAGSDIFVFDTKPAKNNVDTIADFEIGVDKISLNSKIFKGLSVGMDVIASGRIIYDSQTGTLSYDADGASTKVKPVDIALIGTGLSISAGDFIVA